MKLWYLAEVVLFSFVSVIFRITQQRTCNELHIALSYIITIVQSNQYQDTRNLEITH